jgi:hypothetical protein
MNTPSRLVRVFISSTFRDFVEERELPVKKVFPMGYLFGPTPPTLSHAPKSMHHNKRRLMHFASSDGQGRHGIREAYRSEFKRGFLSINAEGGR